MAIAEGMKAIVQEIASTREDRLKGVAGMKEETQDSIKALRGSRKKAAHEFGEELARTRASRKREVKAVVGGARSTIKGLHASRGKESSQMHQELASGLAELKAEVGKRMGEAQRAVIDMHSQREAMGTELRQDLAQSRSGMESEVAELLKVEAETKIELYGLWLWITGETRAVKDELKALGTGAGKPTEGAAGIRERCHLQK